MNSETILAEYYKRYRKLARPKTRIYNLLAFIIAIAIFSFLISAFIAFIFQNMEIIEKDISFDNFFFLCGHIFILLLVLSAKKITILSILLYQHYATEYTRRKCMCMPSCSVYALMVLRKFNYIKAVILIYKRIGRCSTPHCIIDYP